MAKRGQAVTFHGAYKRKADAQKKERATPGAYIEPRRIRGQLRYLVLTRRSPASSGRRRSNPSIMVVGANPRRSGVAFVLSTEAEGRIDYRHAEDGKAYRHKFGPGVRVELMRDGSVRLSHPTRRLWCEE